VLGEVSTTGRFFSDTPLAITSRQSEWISPVIIYIHIQIQTIDNIED
jgi:hypothetical protein